MAESHVSMFKYLFLKMIYTISDVDVVELSGHDVSFKYLLAISPGEAAVNPSSLTKLQKQKKVKSVFD